MARRKKNKEGGEKVVDLIKFDRFLTALHSFRASPTRRQAGNGTPRGDSRRNQWNFGCPADNRRVIPLLKSVLQVCFRDSEQVPQSVPTSPAHFATANGGKHSKNLSRRLPQDRSEAKKSRGDPTTNSGDAFPVQLQADTRITANGCRCSGCI